MGRATPVRHRTVHIYVELDKAAEKKKKVRKSSEKAEKTKKSGGKIMLSKMRILAIAAIVLMGFVGYALASPPVPPPFEGFGISTYVDVVMDAGDFVEQESFTWTWMDGGEDSTLAHPAAPQFLDAGGRAAQIRYTEELNSIDTGFFQFNKMT